MNRPRSFMLIAGEPSGDHLGAELVRALRVAPRMLAQPFPPRFIGAGGPHMQAAGVNLSLDLTEHAVFGISDVLRQYRKFRTIFNQLLRRAETEQPDAVILIDFSGFNRRFARALKNRIRARRNVFRNWDPKLIYYVSPQVWASRESRADSLAKDIDLLLSIFPFEKEWYHNRIPTLRVHYIGHPMIDRFAPMPAATNPAATKLPPLVLLLPGSRQRELDSHLPVLLEAAALIRSRTTIRVRVILPNDRLTERARERMALSGNMEIQTGGLRESLAAADLAIASSGTVTMECAFFRVPTVVIYKTSRLTYEIGRRIIRVKSIAMPNIIAGETIYPERIQDAATAANIAADALNLLENPERTRQVREQLAKVIASLGTGGASHRGAEAILDLWNLHTRADSPNRT
jgi:lipid-A-disaccharide synthase